MTEKVGDRAPSRSLIHEDIDSILYAQTRCCENEIYFAGYRRELFYKSDSTILTLFICTHCKHIFREPWQLKENGAQFCGDCLTHLIAFHSQRFQLSDAFEDIGAKTKLYRIILPCPFVGRGCTWKGPLSQLKDHTCCCGYLKVQCTNEGCQLVRLRNQIGAHQVKECSYRFVQCTLCQIKFRAGFWDRHMKVECQRSMIMCPYKCECKLERGKMQTHIETNCPNVAIRCPFYKYGCVTEFARRELGKHMSLPLQHVSLFTQKFEAYEKDIQGLSIRNDMLLDKIHELEETELGELMIQNRLLQMDNTMLKWQSKLLNLLCDFDDTAMNNSFLWKISDLSEKVRKSGTLQSKTFRLEQGIDFGLQLRFSHSVEYNEGFVQIEVFLVNDLLGNSKIFFKGDANIFILNQNADHEHYSLILTMNNLNTFSLSTGDTSNTIGTVQIPYEEFLNREKYIQNNNLFVKFKIGKLVYSPNPIALD